MAKPAVWTVGYEGRTPDELVAVLRANGIRRLVDVRELPMSRKKGFSKSALAARLEAEGIAYTGMRRLGAPREARHRLRDTGDWESFAPVYQAHLDEAPDAVADCAALAKTEPVALLCFERDAKDCHRGLLAERLAAHGLTAIHL
jgi:uncharacterized protein (DUF488 family)